MSRSFSSGLAFLLALAFTMACNGNGSDQDDGADRWGPLAVINGDGDSVADAGLGRGVIHINEHCVTLQRIADPEYEGTEIADLTLVWRDGQTSWDQDDEEITFDGDRGCVTLEDGDTVRLGGIIISGEGRFISGVNHRCPETLGVVMAVTKE